MAKPPREIRKQPARQPAYKRLYKRVDRLEDRLEDTISHFYKVINELRSRVSTLEKKVKARELH
jgi:tetrahydromethanopterin S-methyltransferase subunit G